MTMRQEQKREVPVIIPAYEPDERFIGLLEEFDRTGMSPVIIVNDGSGSSYDEIFGRAQRIVGKLGGRVLSYDNNMGKGYALKTAFRFVLDTYPEAAGVVTADSDGQHRPADIRRVAEALREHPDSLVLGTRNFSGEDIPWKSRFGNVLTRRVFRYLMGKDISDTQTGLRGVPREIMALSLDIKSNRFEFEMKALVESAAGYPVIEVPVETVYESAEHHQTHFRPVADSVRIYAILAARFLKYSFSSLSSAALDLVMFAVFCALLRHRMPEGYIVFATAAARVISAAYNYIINYKVVFTSRQSVGSSGLRYFILAVCQMSLSALIVTGGAHLMPFMPEVVIKIVADTCLFFASYYIQQKYVFGNAGAQASGIKE